MSETQHDETNGDSRECVQLDIQLEVTSRTRKIETVGYCHFESGTASLSSDVHLNFRYCRLTQEFMDLSVKLLLAFASTKN
jgi:hypothetical protein